MSVKFVDHSMEVKTAVTRQRDIALVEGAAIIEGECIVRCPVDTGHLRGSIGYKAVGVESYGNQDSHDPAPATEEKLQGTPGTGEAIIGTNLSYAAHVEYGTRYQKAQPYMRPGFDKAKPKVTDVFRKCLGTDMKAGG